MITTKKRLDDFLDNYQFYSNSVEFRIKSSKAIERFKNIQAFQLNEIKNGRYKFSKSRRELLLLKFDLLSKVLYESENLCIQFYNEQYASNVVVESVVSLVSKASYLYNKIIKEDHPGAFDPIFSNIWIEMFSINEHLFKKQILSLEGAEFSVFFNNLVDTVSALLQNSTFELFELDVLLMKQRKLYRNHPDCKNPNNTICPAWEYFRCDNFHNCDVISHDMDPDIIDNIRNNIEITRGSRQLNYDDTKCLMLVISNCINSDTENSRFYLKSKMSIFLKYFEIESIYFKNLSDGPVNASVIEEIEKYGIPIDYKGSLSS